MSRLADTSTDPISQAATEWVVRRDRGLSPTEKHAFDLWRTDPKHAAEFARISSGWKRLDRLAPVPQLTAAADAIVLRAKARRNRRRIVVMAGGLLAAAAAFAIAYLGLWHAASPAPDNYQVIASASHEIRLPDGSVAMLNGDSRIETTYTPAERRVHLIQGEALFTVAKNPDRPFYVTAGPVTVRAVGTAFNVRLAACAVEVLVTEGKVRVNDSEGRSLLASDSAGPSPSDGSRPGPQTNGSPSLGVLTAGHRVVVNLAAVVDPSSQARIAALAPYEIEQTLAWQSNRLVFNDTPLDEVIAAFNRYNSQQLTLGDDTLRARRITGTFRADNVDGFTRLLQAGVDVRTERRGEHETVLLPGR